MRGPSLLLLAAAAVASALQVHTHTAAPLCIDLQCPAIAMELGEQTLANDETFTKEQCESCAQCTNHGYSVCMRLAGPARSPGSRHCSCAHSTPANCHNSVMPTSRRPVNITMSAFSICYLSSIQSPTAPSATTNPDTGMIYVTIESFWTEPYWKSLELDNLTLHGEYVLEDPNHCEGELRTVEPTRMGAAPVHTCFYSHDVPMSGKGAEGGAKPVDDYPHSEGFDTYDDELPPELEFLRDHFHTATEVKFYYSVSVRRPRQLTRDSPSDPFRDLTTEVKSEALKYALHPITVKKAEEPKEDAGEEESEEEFPPETDFFAGDKKEDEARKRMKDRVEAAKEKLHVSDAHHDADEDENHANVITSPHSEVAVVEIATPLPTSEEKEETSAEWQEVQPTSDELITEDLLLEHSLNATEVHSESAVNSTDTSAEATTDGSEEEEEEEAQNDDVTSTTTETSESAEIEDEIERERDESEDEEEESTTPEATEETSSAGEEIEQSEEEPAGFVAQIKSLLALLHPADKWGLARLVFGTTLLVSLLIILFTCCCKRDVICGAPATKSAGGYTYNAAGQTRQLVEPSREPLNQ